MSTRNLLSALVVCLLLPGCATQRIVTPCNQSTCKIVVSVGAHCAISPGPQDELEVARGNSPVIQWEIDSDAFRAGWEFARGGGIDFKTPAGGEIDPASHSPRVVTFNDRHTKPGRYQYGINLVNRNGGTCRQDPFVVNL